MQVNKKSSSEEQRDLARIHEAKQKTEEQAARRYLLMKTGAENIKTDRVPESNVAMSVQDRVARYRLVAIIVAFIAIAAIAIAQSTPWFGEKMLQFVLGTTAMLLCMWAVITCEGLSYRANSSLSNNESTLIVLLALTMFFINSTYRTLASGVSSNFDELAVVAAAVLLERWLRLRKQSTDPTQMFTLSFLGRMKRSIFVFAVVVSGIAFIAWLVVASRETLQPVSVAISVLLVASIEMPATAVRSTISEAISRTSNSGIRFNSFSAMMRAAGVNIVVFNGIETFVNKTPELSEIIPAGGLTAPGLLRLSAGLSEAAGMVYAKSIMAAAKEEADIKIPIPKEFTIIPGCGVEGTIETRRILLGNKQLMVERKIDTEQVRGIVEELSGAGRKIIYIATRNKIAGIMAFEFKPRSNAKAMVDSIKRIGLSVALLTSESQRIADTIAKEIGVDRVYVIAQSAQRIEKIAELKSRGLRVAVIGGQNGESDALAAASDIYLRLRSGNSQRYELAKVNGDNIVEVKEDDFDIASAFSTSRAAIDGVRKINTIFAGYNIIAILIAAGLLYPVFGIIMRPGIAALCMLGCSLLMLDSSKYTGQPFAFIAD